MWQVLAILMLLAGAACYLTGVRHHKPWGTPAVVLFMIGAIAAGVLHLVALPLFGLAAVAAYQWGVKRHKLWGAPATGLCALLAIVLTVVGHSHGRPATGQQRQESQPVYAVGKALRGKLRNGAEVFILRQPLTCETARYQVPPPPGLAEMERLERRELRQREREFQEALSEAVGVRVKLVGSAFPVRSGEASGQMLSDAKAFSEILDKHPNISAWISLMGMPTCADGRWELDQVSTFERAKPPLVAVDVMGPPEGLAAAHLRKWIESGLLEAIVYTPPGLNAEPKVITKQNVNELAGLDAAPPAPTEEPAAEAPAE